MHQQNKLQNGGTKYMTEWEQQIKELRIKTEKAVEILKELEKKGTDESAINALWAANRVCGGIEFTNIEQKLTEKGYKHR